MTEDDSVVQTELLTTPFQFGSGVSGTVEARAPYRRTPSRGSSKRGAPSSPPGLMRGPIIRSKIQAPQVRERTVSRGRLTDWLAARARTRLRLVIADAGYGKSTLITDYVQSADAKSMWYRLDTSDQDWVTLLSYLVAAGRELQPSFAQATSELLLNVGVTNVGRDIVLASYIAELEALCVRPVLLVLDDFHLADDSPDARAILSSLLHGAPENLTLLVASRHRPSIPLARMLSQGQVDELSTVDLRFSASETQALFADAYGVELDTELMIEVQAKTEGWAASLSLIYSSVRNLPPSEIRRFILRLSGARGSIYDFLAEEVVLNVSIELQRFLMRVAVLETVESGYALALFVDDSDVSMADILKWSRRASELGLLIEAMELGESYRLHPLLRDFLKRRLHQAMPPEDIRGLHLSVASRAEHSDWLTACHHFAEAGCSRDAMRVLSDAAPRAVGTGSWGAAAGLMNRIVDVEPPPSVRVLLARGLVATRPEAAIEEVNSVLAVTIPPVVRALALQTKAAALWNIGDGEGLLRCVDETAADESLPTQFLEIARAHQAMLEWSKSPTALGGVNLLLQDLGGRQASSGAHYHSAISFHNAACVELERGDFSATVRLCERALEGFALVGPRVSEAYSTHALLAAAFFELGRRRSAEEHASVATDVSSPASADAFAAVAGLLAVMGDERFDEVMAEARQRTRDGRGDWGGLAGMMLAQARLDLASGHFEQCLTRLSGAPALMNMQVSLAFARPALEAIASAALGLPGGMDRLQDVEEWLESKGAWYWHGRLGLVREVLGHDPHAILAAVNRAQTLGRLILPELADVLASRLHVLHPTPDSLKNSIQAYPARWLPALRRAVEGEHPPSARACAQLIADFGTSFDVPRLVAYERRHRWARKPSRLSRQLARRVSPKLVVHDLGRVLYEVGDRRIEMSKTRRKAASLLTYLICRGGGPATKDQVIDSLWPDLDPDSASNSLNQTLYFLRRDIDEFFDDLTSPNYVVYEAELVWVDAELVSADSIEFHLQAVRASGEQRGSLRDREELLKRYTGQFAPEFQYEQWAISWREAVHAAYLHCAHDLVADLAGAGRLERSAMVCRRALAVDAEALDFERALVWLYSALGSEAASVEQYQHYRKAFEDETGLEGPTFEAVKALTPSRYSEHGTRGD